MRNELSNGMYWSPWQLTCAVLHTAAHDMIAWIHPWDWEVNQKPRTRKQHGLVVEIRNLKDPLGWVVGCDGIDDMAEAQRVALAIVRMHLPEVR